MKTRFIYKILSMLFVLTLLPMQISLAEGTATFLNAINTNCNKNLNTSFSKLKNKKGFLGKDSAFYTKKFSSIEQGFKDRHFNSFDMTQLFDQLKLDISKNSSSLIKQNKLFIDFKNKLEICKKSLVAYYRMEYISDCINDCGKAVPTCKNKCKTEAKSSKRWFNDM